MQDALHQQAVKALVEKFYSSQRIANIRRADYVEGLVLAILGPPWRLVSDWSSWDLENDAHVRLEVKQAAACQSWHTEEPRGKGSPSFDIAPRTGYWDASGYDAIWIDAADLTEDGLIRPADIYIFAWHPEINPQVADHRRADQWQFFVVPEYLLTRRHGAQKTISLNPLKKLASPVTYDRLAPTVAAILADMARQEAEYFSGAAEIAERIRQGKEHTYSSEEVRAHLGMES